MDANPSILPEEIYSRAVVGRLARFSSNDQIKLTSWLRQNPVGSNCALQILKALEDLSKKEAEPPALVFAALLREHGDTNLSPKPLGKKILQMMKGRLHVRSTEHRDRFHAFVRKLKLPPDTSLYPPQNFEGDTFALQVKFKEAGTLKKSLEQVLASLDTGPWEELEEF